MSGTRPVPYMPEQLGRVIQAGLSGAGEPEKALRELIDLAEWALRSADKPNVGTGGTLDDRRDLEPQRPNETELDNDIRRALQEADQGERNCRVDLATGLNTKTPPAILAEGRERAAWMRRLAIAALRGVCVTPVAAPAVSRGPGPTAPDKRKCAHRGGLFTPGIETGCMECAVELGRQIAFCELGYTVEHEEAMRRARGAASPVGEREP